LITPKIGHATAQVANAEDDPRRRQLVLQES
jgi:hypothetical protein